jgi:hypothetical protein
VWRESQVIGWQLHRAKRRKACLWIARAKQGSHRADPEGWLEFQRLLHWYLWNAIREVYIPYAKALSNLIPAKTVRFRRDTSQLLTAINAHTLLHHDLRFAEGGVIQADIHRTPREVPSEILALYHREKNPLKALRARCLDCCCGQASEVRKCTAVGCPSWPFRMGDPFRQQRVLSPEQGQAMAKRLHGGPPK